MIYKYTIQHAGQSENIGYVVADSSKCVSEIAKNRFKGWDVGSTFSCKAVLQKKHIIENNEPKNLGWVNSMFANF